MNDLRYPIEFLNTPNDMLRQQLWQSTAYDLAATQAAWMLGYKWPSMERVGSLGMDLNHLLLLTEEEDL